MMLMPGNTFYVDDKYKGMISSHIEAKAFMDYACQFYGYQHAEVKEVGNAPRVYFYTEKPEPQVMELKVKLEVGDKMTIVSGGQKYYVYIGRNGKPILSQPI